jgi:hypothetical protein
LLLLAVLFPVAVYLGILGWINRRPRGLLVRGPWDFAGILLAASGLILFGGPALLNSLIQTENWRDFWLTGRFIRDASDPLALGRVVLYGCYFLIVVAASALVMRHRRRLTSIYNVHPSLVEQVLGETFRRWRLSFLQTGNVLLIEPVQAAGPEQAAPPSVLVERVTTLEIEASLALYHVTLAWDPADSLLRHEVESRLRHALAREPAPGGAVGDWFLLAASTLFFLLVLGLGLVVWLMSRTGRF